MSGPLPTLVLASASPRRRELLSGLGLEFEIRLPAIDETRQVGEAPHGYVRRLAMEKVSAVARPGEIAIGADTIVVLEGQVLGKPVDAADARRMLHLIAGREHTVLTGVALSEPSQRRVQTVVEATRVRIMPLSDETIHWYVDTGEPLDKAGAYAVQGLGAVLVEGVFGSYTNVVGLPLPALHSLMSEFSYDLLAFRSQAALVAVPVG
jgi:septum formation protein